MVSKEIPGLDPATERGFQLDTGELVAVKVQRPRPSPGVVAVTISARAVNADGSTLVVADHPVEMPGYTVSVLVENLGDGSAVLLPEIAAAMEREARKVRGFAAALTALSTFGTA
jgi:hypothetical protein